MKMIYITVTTTDGETYDIEEGISTNSFDSVLATLHAIEIESMLKGVTPVEVKFEEV